MKIAIIGAGFTGLTAALRLLQRGHQVTVFEQQSFVGGLAAGFREPSWNWPLEMHYHHIFATDKYVQKLAAEIGHEYKFYDVNTASLFDTTPQPPPTAKTRASEKLGGGEGGGIGNLEYWRLDSPAALLRFGKLSLVDRVRMGAVLAYLRYLASWQKLDKIPAHDWLARKMGRAGYETIWQPLFQGKFGPHHQDVNAAWFWARIKARSQKLGYFTGGFTGLANALADTVRTSGGQINLQYPIEQFQMTNHKWIVNEEEFNKVIVASTANVLLKLAPELPQNYQTKLTGLKGLGSLNVILRLKEEFLPNNIYWLNIHAKDWPMIAIVEHTHMISKVHYHNENLVYVAKYLPADDEHMTWPDKKLLDWYAPCLAKIKPGWEKHLIGYRTFRAPFTQPVMPTGMASHIPPLETGLPGLYMAGMQQVYPWDRGTNFAVELGERVAQLI